MKRLVFAASSSAYGDTPTLPKHEAMPTNPLSPYALQKLVAEQYCQMFTRLYGLETVTIRYFNVFGPRQDPSSPYSGVISLFIRALVEGRQPTIYGDGEQTRDFTFVADAVAGRAPVIRGDGQAGRDLLSLALMDARNRTLRWLATPGTRLVRLDGEWASPASGAARLLRLFDEAYDGAAPFADRRSLRTVDRPARMFA